MTEKRRGRKERDLARRLNDPKRIKREAAKREEERKKDKDK